MPETIFDNHDRDAGNKECNEVGNQEGTAPVLMGHIAEAPDISQTAADGFGEAVEADSIHRAPLPVPLHRYEQKR